MSWFEGLLHHTDENGNKYWGSPSTALGIFCGFPYQDLQWDVYGNSRYRGRLVMGLADKVMMAEVQCDKLYETLNKKPIKWYSEELLMSRVMLSRVVKNYFHSLDLFPMDLEPHVPSDVDPVKNQNLKLDCEF